MKPIVAVDMDDTICHLVHRSIFYYNQEYPSHPVKYEDIITWDFDEILHPDCSVDQFFGRPGLFEELDLFDEYVIEEMIKLHESSTLWIVTAAWPTAVPEKWNWLQKHMPFIPHSNFFPIKQKSVLPYDILVDDGAHNLLAAIHTNRPVICIPHPWNEKERIAYNMPIANSWKGMNERVHSELSRRKENGSVLEVPGR